MTNRELKNMIKNAYDVESSGNSRAFVGQFQKREMHALDILKQQTAGLGFINAFAGLIVLFVFWQIALYCQDGDALMYARISAIVPLVALVAFSGMGRSEKYGMDELEMASRFSLRTVLAARLIIVGVIDAVIFVVLMIIFGQLANMGGLQALSIVSVPYLITAWGCLLITRKLHNSMDMAACVGFGGMVCLMCVSTGPETPWRYLFMGNIVSYMLCTVLLAMFGLEIYKLLKGDNYRWNLC